MKNHLKKNGLTLIEVLITMAIVSGIVIIITMFGLNISDYNLLISQDLEAQAELQQALRGILSEVRSMGPSNNGSYPIMEATASSFTFHSDIDKDGLFERVKYYIDGSIFKKSVIKPTGNPLIYNQANEKISELVHNVVVGASSSFTYYDKNYTGTEATLTIPINIPLVRMLKIQLMVDKDPNTLPGPINFSATVMIRNFRE